LTPAAPVAVSEPALEPRSRPPRHLRHRAQFEAVLASVPAAKTPHFALHMADTSAHRAPTGLFPAEGPWVGVLLPKRWARRAVTRNTLRRQIYALAAEWRARLPDAALVVRLRSGFDRRAFPSATSAALKVAARTELQALLGRVAVPGAVA
jgi:ribonuclease P protein component